MTQASFSLRARNPDVLTCIANLSNDEVFTPPEVADRMLDLIAQGWAQSHGGADIWSDSTATFLDPFTKSGVFLREITTRLVGGLEGEFPDLQERVNHILTKQVFGIAITKLTSLLARRSLYCSKFANGPHSIAEAFTTDEGNIWFERVEHAWVRGNTWVLTADENGNEVRKYKDGKCKYCGTSQMILDRGIALESHAYAFIHSDDIKATVHQMFGGEMQFDVVVGNPPYQLNDGGGSGSSAMPIYQKFVKQAMNLSPHFLAMIVPARWYSGGKGLDDFRVEMLHDKRLRTLVDFPDSRDVFTGVEIAGGVCYFLWDRENEGECLVETNSGGETFTHERWLDAHEVFIRDNRTLEIVEKVNQLADGLLSDIVSPRNPFNVNEVPVGSTGDVLVYSSKGDGRMSRDEVGRNHSWIDEWKVLLSKTTSEHAGQTDKSGRRRVLSRMEVMPPGTACTGSYLLVGPFDSEQEAANALGYLRTRFVRFLVSAVLLTQNITRSAFQFVPAVDFSRAWTDEDLYALYGLGSNEVTYIESVIRSMDAEDISDA